MKTTKNRILSASLKYIVPSTLLIASNALAAQYDTNQHIEFSYTLDCSNPLSYCLERDPFVAHSVFALDQAPSEPQSEELPLYLTISPAKDWQYLKEQTYTILGLSVATVGFMTLLPESITKWDDESKSFSDLGTKWKENVKAGPTWDKDEHILNYIMHPYFGGVYYTAARHSGFDEFESFIYSWTMSTFFWEYGVEAFAEVPSWQDLFITPFFGAMVGEMMFEAEQDIVANGGEVMGSKSMGSFSLFFLNPVGHIHYWVTEAWGGEAEFNFVSTPWFGNQDAATFAMDAGASYDYQFVGAELKIKF
ncbi:DUF3943 domain-containing protein [Vibrio algarum]|uniref:DUF3943 domain-containing protein n=1 Tax=Vibrio algarum TaxID=3020714 RepID=UPI00389AFBF9